MGCSTKAVQYLHATSHSVFMSAAQKALLFIGNRSTQQLGCHSDPRFGAVLLDMDYYFRFKTL